MNDTKMEERRGRRRGSDMLRARMLFKGSFIGAHFAQPKFSKVVSFLFSEAFWLSHDFPKAALQAREM